MSLLDAHRPEDADEAHSLEEIRRWLPRLSEPFSRHQADAHLTASALVVDASSGRIALLHHAKLRRWLQPGGHVEPTDAGIMHRAALREAQEETGCEVRLHDPTPTLLDVDVHGIPVRPDEPAHLHLDLRFLLTTDDAHRLTADPAESSAIGWFTFEAALAKVDDGALQRLIRKGRRAIGGG